MVVVNVYSPIDDKSIEKNLTNSPIWANCYHEDELELAKTKHKNLICYRIKFDGVSPVQVTKVIKL